MKNLNLLGLIKFALLISLAGCGNGGGLTNSYVDQQRGREKDMAQQLKSDYKPVAGVYNGTGGRYESIVATIRVKNAPKDGFLVAQPRITGYFYMTPKAITGDVLKDGKPTTLPIYDGVYDATSREFAAHMISASGSPGSDINCAFTSADFSQMECSWIPIQGSEYFEFTLTKTKKL